MTDVELLAPTYTPVDAKLIMEKMKRLVREALPNALVWETALSIIEDVAPRHEDEQCLAFREWMKSRFRFVNDPVNVQLLKSPVYLLEKIRDRGFVQGNCADAGMLAAALCGAVRIRCNYVSVAFGSDHANYSHVFTMAFPHTATGTRSAVEFDVTRPAGLAHADFTRQLEVGA